MYNGDPPAKGARGQLYFKENMLHKAYSLNSVTPERSKLREGGLIYSQFYSSVKELSDAAKCKPFDHDSLEEIALDPQIRQGAQALAGGSRRDAKVIKTAYIASKKRARYALKDSLYKSFGCREEHRLRWSSFVGLIERLHAEEYCQLKITLTECPTYI